jgi:dynein heavy chain, axonemal
MKDYDKDNVPPELVAKVNPILTSEDYTEAKMKQTSVAALGISNWTKAIVEYDEAMKVVKPKQIELKAAKEESAKATAAEDEAKANLAKVEAAFAKLSAELLEAQQKEASLKAQQADCERKLDLANSLIHDLAGEKENWIKLLALRRNDKECIVGDTIVCSGFLAYLGVFIASYRTQCVTGWVDMLLKFSIKCTKDLSLVTVLGNPVKITEW